MDIYLQPIDERYFLICGPTDGLERELSALGAFAETTEEGLSVWKALHRHRLKFEHFIQTGKIFVQWDPSMMLEVKINDRDGRLSSTREQLTRIGKYMVKENKKTLFQMCHLATRGGKIYLVHAYEIMEMTNNSSPLTIFDLEERDIVANILQDWGYLTIPDPSKHKSVNKSMLMDIVILSKEKKYEWNLTSIYDSL